MRVESEQLTDDGEVRVPVVIGHAVGSIDDEDDVLAIHGNATDRRRERPACPLLEQALHLGAELLIGGDQLAFRFVRNRGLLAAAGVLPLDVRKVAGQAGKLLPLVLQGDLASLQLPVELVGLATQGIQLSREGAQLAVEILAALLQLHRLADLRQHEQQDDRPEAATDAVEKRQAEDFDLATTAHYEHPLMANPSPA